MLSGAINIYKNIEIKLLEMKTTVSDVKIYKME